MSLDDLLYDVLMYPLEALVLRRARRALVAAARGRVLELGAGTGANLRFYRWERLRELHLLDLDPGSGLSSLRAVRGVPVWTHRGDVRDLPFPDASFDTVVATLLFCSVPEQAAGLTELRRVLAPRGRYILLEHVRPENRLLRRAVAAADPLWLAANGRCSFMRDTLAAIRTAGFDTRFVRSSGAGMLVQGVARPR